MGDIKIKIDKNGTAYAVDRTGAVIDNIESITIETVKGNGEFKNEVTIRMEDMFTYIDTED